MADISITVGLTTKTCHRGHFYAIPYWVGSVVCPFCASDEIRSAERRAENAERAIPHLRGVITRLKKRVA
jgi:hypothetical protein